MQGFFSEYSLFLIVLFAAVVFVFLSIILALGVYICKVRFEKEMPLGGIHIMTSALKPKGEGVSPKSDADDVADRLRDLETDKKGERG